MNASTRLVTYWELHLHRTFVDGRFSARFSTRVRTVGGSYSHCRGHEERRFVRVPNTPDGRLVVDEILRASQNDLYCVIARGLWSGLPAWIFVIDGPCFDLTTVESKLERNFNTAKSRGIKVAA